MFPPGHTAGRVSGREIHPRKTTRSDVSFERRQPKPRPAGFRNDFNSLNRPVDGNRLGGANRSPQQRPGQRPGGRPGGRAAPKRKGPPPKVRVPETPRERRDMLKAAAWRMSKIVHCLPKAIMTAPDPMALIKVPDPRARELAKKIIRLKGPA